MKVLAKRTRRSARNLVFGLIILLTLLLKIPSITWQQHHDGDEEIYVSLAKNLHDSGSYTLQNTAILSRLSPSIYNKPLFHHPPLSIFLMIPLILEFGDRYAVLVAWFGHLLTLLAAFLFLRVHVKSLLWLSVFLLAVALDPILVFTSQKIWMDSLLSGFFALAVVLFLLGFDEPDGNRRTLWFWAGVAWGLALLVKLPAGLCAPIFAVAAVYGYALKPDKRRVKDLLYVFVPALVLSAPWFFKFYGYFGVLMPTWIKPDAWLLSHIDIIYQVTNRPWFYFVKELLLLNPFFLLGLVLQLVFWKSAAFRERMLWVWFVLFVGALTVLGAQGAGFQMRFIAPAMLPLYLVGAVLMERAYVVYPRLALGASALALLYNAATCAFYIVRFERTDISSMVEKIKWP